MEFIKFVQKCTRNYLYGGNGVPVEGGRAQTEKERAYACGLKEGLQFAEVSIAQHLTETFGLDVDTSEVYRRIVSAGIAVAVKRIPEEQVYSCPATAPAEQPEPKPEAKPKRCRRSRSKKAEFTPCSKRPRREPRESYSPEWIVEHYGLQRQQITEARKALGIEYVGDVKHPKYRISDIRKIAKFWNARYEGENATLFD